MTGIDPFFETKKKLWKNQVRTTPPIANDKWMPYLSFYKNPGVNRTYHFFTILSWKWPILKFFFANFLQLFEGKKIIEGVIWQKFAEVRNESIGNKLQLCFSEDLSQTFRTPLKNGFKKVGRVTGIRPPYRNNPALP